MLISVVLPIHNEQANIPTLYAELVESLSGGAEPYDFELVFVDDGSQDASAMLIRELREGDKRVKFIQFSRNFGHQAAVTAGMDAALGEVVILMDADLQDPPSLLPQMVDAWKKGADVVYAVRTKRKESVFLRTAYFLYYRLLKVLSNIEIPLDSGDFCLMSRRVVNELKQMPERNRFLRGLRSWVGFNQVALEYERHARHAGKSSYNFSRLLRLGLSGIFSFSSFPLRLATYLGFLVCVSGLLFLTYVVADYFVRGNAPQGWTSLTVLFLFVGGIQLLILGAIGEYVALIHEEAKQRPHYVIKEFLD